MSLDATNFHPQGPVKSVDLMQFYNLFTGVMTDQPVAFSNSLTVGGNQGLTTVPLRLYGATGQNTDLIDLYADHTQALPGFGINAPGRLAWGPGGGAQDTFLSRVASQNGHVGDTLGLLVDPYLEVKGNLVTTSPGAVGTRTKPGIPNDADVLSPLDGMLIIDTANHAFYFRSGAQWRQVTGGGGGAATTVEEEFVPANGATTINLNQKPTDILVVSRNGLVQSEASGHYTWLDFTLTFADPFRGTERVVVAYCIGSLVPSMAGPTTSVHEEFKPALGALTVVLSQVPQTISMVARDGVVQSATDGNYTLSVSTLTFSDAFSGTERVVVDYASTQFTPLINTNNIADGGIQTVDLADRSVTNVKLASDTARQNLLTNGGFEIWQRGNGPFSIIGGYCADRWFLDRNGTSTVSVTPANSFDPLGGLMAVVGYTHVAGGNASIMQKIENGTALREKTITFSARVQANQPNNVRLRIGDSAANTWSTYHPGGGAVATLSVTHTVTPAATFVYVFVEISAASDTARVDSAVLVLGSVPADYAPLHPVDDLARCLRYYEASYGNWLGAGYVSVGTSAEYHYKNQSVKGGAPTITFAAPGAFFTRTVSGVLTQCTSVAANNSLQDGAEITASVSGGLSPGQGTLLYTNTGNAVRVEWNP